jgi:HSP20 family protein
MFPMLKNKNYFPAFVDDFFARDLFPGFLESKTGISTPAVNVIETKDEYKIEIAAPGLNKEDFKVDVDNSILIISSEKEIKYKEKDEKYMRCEFNYSSFKRSFALPDSVSIDKITASHQNGILIVNVPKKEEAIEKPVRQVQIS